LTWVDYTALLESQGNRCAVCRRDNSGQRDWHVDHDHVNGKIRGLLCNPCNLLLGLAADDADVLRQAALYLDQYLVREYAAEYT